MTSWFSDETCRPAFDIKETPRISFGLRFPIACAQHIDKDFNKNRVFVIASKTLSIKTDALEKLKTALGDRLAGFHIGISPHTPLEELVDIIIKAKSVDTDCFVTLGAGSITDGAKIVRYALANGAITLDKIRRLVGKPPHQHALPTIPLICVPTTLSGGEYQAIAGATDPDSKSKDVFYPIVDPDLVIQDPELCSTTPERIWLSTGVRSIDHCVETLCSLQSNQEADSWARRGLIRLASALPKSRQAPSDLEARHQCQLAVVESMRAVSCGVPLGASHAIGHQLGPLGVPHGETSCILLPAVCRYNASVGENHAKQAPVVKLLLENALPESALGQLQDEGNRTDLASVLDVLFKEMGMPRRLSEVGIARDKLPLVARNSLNDVWIKTNAVVITSEEQVMEILEQVA
ncbi:hypothetical protein NW762_012484 [Fusarium torreyae]|uniref:Alcohol dehydrogenase iron-type/glycerol dehydrogenase GldA domain-containing protein n=1 Tax=Fusarium torreyae TaxID=1237075 RepID=A0A9W8VBG7_9HYPO|nr:hypothetical protein NW762_012484 [Fusarium torreyae]